MLVRFCPLLSICRQLKSKLPSPYLSSFSSSPSTSNATKEDAPAPHARTNEKMKRREELTETEAKEESVIQFRPSKEFYNAQSEEDREKLDQLIHRIALLNYEIHRMPKEIRDKDWEVMMRCKTERCLRNRLYFVYTTEQVKLSEKRDKEARKSPQAMENKARVHADDKERVERGEIVYGLNYNNMLLRMTRQRINAVEHAKLASMVRLHATPTLAIDCDFLPKQSDKELAGAGVQVQYLMSNNIKQREPWQLSFVNFDKTAPRMKEFMDIYMTKLESRLEAEEKNELNLRYPRIEPIVTSQSYLDLYPRERLVYLSPDGEEELEEIDSDCVYIMGGIVDVDKSNRPSNMEVQASLGKAKRDGVRALRLPLNKYIKWQTGHMLLPFNVVVKIMMDVYSTRGDWRYSLLKNTSKRNLVPIVERNQATRQRYHQFGHERKGGTSWKKTRTEEIEEEDDDERLEVVRVK